MYETTAYGAACCAGAGTDHPANSMYTALILPELHPDVPTHVTRVNPQMLEVLQTLSRFVPIRYCKDAEDTIIATMEHYCKACFGETDTDDIRQETIDFTFSITNEPPRVDGAGIYFYVEGPMETRNALIGKQCRKLEKAYPGLVGYLLLLLHYAPVNIFFPWDYYEEIERRLDNWQDGDDINDYLNKSDLRKIFPDYCFYTKKDENYTGAMPDELREAAALLAEWKEQGTCIRDIEEYFDLPAVWLQWDRINDHVTERIIDDMLEYANEWGEALVSPKLLRFELENIRIFLRGFQGAMRILHYLDPQFSEERR